MPADCYNLLTHTLIVLTGIVIMHAGTFNTLVDYDIMLFDNDTMLADNDTMRAGSYNFFAS